jgi:hypothetical protein
MPNKISNIQGKRFGKLIVLSMNPIRQGGLVAWDCLCDCGNKATYVGATLRYKQANSCGCLRREVQVTHGLSHTKSYASWSGMMRRCYDEEDQDYCNYGARGIRVCRRWHKFVNFYEDMGDRPAFELTLERIDVNGNYEPSNCKWATWLEQANNKRPFSKQHIQNMRHPKKKGYKQSEGHKEKRVAAYSETMLNKKENRIRELLKLFPNHKTQLVGIAKQAGISLDIMKNLMQTALELGLAERLSSRYWQLK